MDFPRVLEAAWHDMAHHRIAEGASTLTMQLAGGLFLNRSDRSFHRKIEETMLALQIERHYTKEQIFTMYCNQIYLGSGNYGFEAASEYYFDVPVGKLTLAQAATLAAIIRGPIYSPTTHPERALARRNLVLDLMLHDGKISRRAICVGEQGAAGIAAFPLRGTIWPPISSRISGNISSIRTERRRYTNRACAFIRRSTCRHKRRRTKRCVTACTPMTGGTAGAGNFRIFCADNLGTTRQISK